ncbi:SpoIID/LytB domain-containing protein [Ruminiclostridium papyrosolvens]|uniref:Stage II sporulation protein SpoIID n=1 Tax=Ruminiclostridium papyrosolvens C7 TaxID=1330534 RepID=U4R6Z8_9FIRM|nr:SpoIID/LytB domain-containing protein [Ruminiclostridium papyrosolvens]EPR13950.1 stage II sporulation protein SpoIID [Ruminiclostridium papyrosolvens C7]
MKKMCLFLCIVMIFMMLTGFNNLSISAAEATSVKIGLYYGSTAQSQINISGDKGVLFFAYDVKTGKYNNVYESDAGQTITLRKDSYFIQSGTKFTSVALTGNPTSGPYHIQLNGIYNTYNDTVSLIQGYSQKGVTTYPVYTDSGWQIWTGFYVSKSAAQAAVNTVKSKLGENTYTVIDETNSRIYSTDQNGKVLFMYASSNSLLRGRSISSVNPNTVKIGTTLYRGQVEFNRLSGSDMTIINVLPFEEYLYGVVPNEMPAYSNIEALKAQAVAARTYSYKSINKHSKYGFNLCATTDCQVYKGYSSENANTNKAVDETRDMVVTYNGTLAETVFSASTGGRTEDVVNVWGNSIPYLKSVEDNYESGKSYNYNWTMKFTADEINTKLKSYGLGTVTGIEITKCSAAGRPIEMVITGTLKPEGVIITKDKCRTFLSLPSQMYNISSDANINVQVNNKIENVSLSQIKVITSSGEKSYTDPNQKVTIVGADGKESTVSASPAEYVFTGKGWGHAVGMSQEGAMGMAKAGFTFEQILTHYYTGTKIEIKK